MAFYIKFLAEIGILKAAGIGRALQNTDFSAAGFSRALQNTDLFRRAF